MLIKQWVPIDFIYFQPAMQMNFRAVWLRSRYLLVICCGMTCNCYPQSSESHKNHFCQRFEVFREHALCISLTIYSFIWNRRKNSSIDELAALEKIKFSVKHMTKWKVRSPIFIEKNYLKTREKVSSCIFASMTIMLLEITYKIMQLQF